MSRILFPLFWCFLVVSCGPSALPPEAFAPKASPAPTVAPTNYRYEVFQVVDSVGVAHGVGYDIFDGDKAIIHQTTIPGEQGIDGFVNDEEAERVADMVVKKLEAGGGFPTISHDELVALGITLKSK